MSVEGQVGNPLAEQAKRLKIVTRPDSDEWLDYHADGSEPGRTPSYGGRDTRS